MAKDAQEVQEYLARIRKTIEASKNLVSQVDLRIAETDRMLERQGLTREQVMAMHFSDAQMEAVNEELKRRGMGPLEKWSNDDRWSSVADMPGEPRRERRGKGEDAREKPQPMDAELENRQLKFGMMMKPFQI